ncbi:MAG: hypothetical protein MI924_29175, partial [Chloroflexales bacterium]|nr:hypothetical protein [Chloroflexales bacterium]
MKSVLPDTTLTLQIRRQSDGSLVADAILASAASAAPVQLAADVPVDFDRTALHGASLNAVAYGRALTA